MRRLGLWIAIIAALDACVDDPTFIQSDGGDAGAITILPDGGTASSSSGGAPGARCSNITCDLAGGKCDGDTCVITCPGDLGCGQNVRCPEDGADCRVTCSQKDQCRRVSCGSGATKCTVSCTGTDSCGEVFMESPSSTITCEGKDACKKVECRGASCNVTCIEQACKAEDVQCCARECTVNGGKRDCD